MRAAVAALLALAPLGCGHEAGRPASPPAPLPVRIVDLTPLLDPADGVKVEPRGTERPVHVAMSNVTLFTHGGAHYDPPSHLYAGAPGADHAPLERLVGPLHLVDLRTRARTAALARADFEGQGIGPGDVVVAFVGCPPPHAEPYPRCPYLGAEAAAFLAQIPVRAYATDAWTLANPALFDKFAAAAADPNGAAQGRPEDWVPEHAALLGRGVPVIEGLTNLEALVGAHDRRAVFVALPLKLKDGDGAPLRAAAFVY
jgi:kynurenine formamidase